MTQHRFPAIVLAYCRNTTENGQWCKSQEAIDEWLVTHRKQLVYQDTKVLPYIWQDDPIVDDHPYYGDKENYFPTIKQMISALNDAIIVDPVAKSETIPYDEVYFGLNKIQIVDSHFSS